MATDTWNGSTADWYTSADWSAGIPTRTSAVVINSGEPQLLSGDPGFTVASIRIGGGSLWIADPSQTQHVRGSVSIASGASVSVDASGSNAGGSTLAIGGNMNNSGGVTIGEIVPPMGGYSLTSASTVTVGGSLSNASGASITLAGSPSPASAQATLNVAGAAGFGAAGVETGNVSLSGSSLLEFGRGQITAIQGTLSLLGSGARVADAGATSSNSALRGLSTVSGTLALESAAGYNGGTSVTTSGNLTITSSGVVKVDPVHYASVFNNGGSSLTIGGRLSNAGVLAIGNEYSTATTVRVNGPGGIVNTGTITIDDQTGSTSLTSAGPVWTSGTITVGYVGGEAPDAGRTASLVAPHVNVIGGTLKGLGVVTGTINNTGGDVMAINSYLYNTLTVQGDYRQSGGGSLQTDFNGRAGLLAVSGGIHLSGGNLLINGITSLTLNTPYTVATFTPGDLTGKFAHIQTEGSLGNHTGNGNSVDLGNGDTLKVLYNNAAGTIQVEEVATPATAASTSGSASATTAGASAASQNAQAALLTQYAASNFAPAAGAAAVVTTPQVAATPLLATPHHA